MGGLITTAARFKDDVTTSFRHYTCNNFNLLLREEEFKKEMKKSCPSSCISPKRKYIHLPKDQVIKKFSAEFSKTKNNYVYGNNFFAPVWYGMNFYDYKKKVAFSISDYSDNLHFLTYTFMNNPLIQNIIKSKNKDSFSEKDLIRWSHNVPDYILSDIWRFKELKNINALYDLNGERLELADMDVLQAIVSLFIDEDGFRYIDNKYSILNVRLPDWEFYSDSRGKPESFLKLYDYLSKENILTKNDKFAWDLFIENKKEEEYIKANIKYDEEE